jgi:hypothetical protein
LPWNQSIDVAVVDVVVVEVGYKGRALSDSIYSDVMFYYLFTIAITIIPVSHWCVPSSERERLRKVPPGWFQGERGMVG